MHSLSSRTCSTSTNQLNPFSFFLACGGEASSRDGRCGRRSSEAGISGRYLNEPGNGSGRERRCRCRWLTCACGRQI